MLSLIQATPPAPFCYHAVHVKGCYTWFVNRNISKGIGLKFWCTQNIWSALVATLRVCLCVFLKLVLRVSVWVSKQRWAWGWNGTIPNTRLGRFLPPCMHKSSGSFLKAWLPGCDELTESQGMKTQAPTGFENSPSASEKTEDSRSRRCNFSARWRRSDILSHLENQNKLVLGNLG